MATDNDAMMAKFIETAAPKLLEALTAQLEPLIEKQIGGLKKNSEKLLDELHTEKGAREEQSTLLDETRAFLVSLGENPPQKKDDPNVFKQPDAHKISRSDARNPSLYQKAKAAAAEAGATLDIVEDA